MVERQRALQRNMWEWRLRRPSVGKAICHSIPPVQCLGTEKITCNPMLKSVTLAFMSVHTGLQGNLCKHNS